MIKTEPVATPFGSVTASFWIETRIVVTPSNGSFAEGTATVTYGGYATEDDMKNPDAQPLTTFEVQLPASQLTGLVSGLSDLDTLTVQQPGTLFGGTVEV